MNACTGTGGRGCSCEFHTRRRPYARAHAARQRAEKLAQKNAGSSICQARLGQFGRCGGMLETVTDGNGGTTVACRLCERKRRGVCRECSRPVDGQTGKALRCVEHKRLEKDRAWRRHRRRDPEGVRRSARRNYQGNDERRRARNEYKKAWRKANADKVRAYKRRYIEKHASNPDSAYRQYHAKYRETYREQKRALERDRLKVAPPPRKTAPKCSKCGKSTRWKPVPNGGSGRPWTTCNACVPPCVRAARQRNRRRQLARAKAWTESIPTKVKLPPQMAERGPGWERLCITPGCDTVVTHRKKKCTKCQRHDAAIAAEKLAPLRGRGRRTDLKRVA